ncbi:MAG: hypothetical protein K2M91_00300, partial [Lachnospiraceae bacterium]|nr:hypothetical protein [Lachnospiraceae bacterium]
MERMQKQRTERIFGQVKMILNKVLSYMAIIGFCVIFICLTRFCIYKTVNSQAETDNSEKTELPLDLADTDETEDGEVKRRLEQLIIPELAYGSVSELNSGDNYKQCDQSNYTAYIESEYVNGAYIEYPQIKGLEDLDLQNKINETLKNETTNGAKAYEVINDQSVYRTFVDFN